MADLIAFQKTLGYEFRNQELLRLALTHPSIAHEIGSGAVHNQRLEFLGDAVLQLVVTMDLYKKFPDFGEGPLTQARAQMVNRKCGVSVWKQSKPPCHPCISRAVAGDMEG